jgi:hypothetical protein
MNLRFVTRKVHAYLDYPVAIGLMALPFVLGLGVSNPLGKWLSVGLLARASCSRSDRAIGPPGTGVEAEAGGAGSCDGCWYPPWTTESTGAWLGRSVVATVGITGGGVTRSGE